MSIVSVSPKYNPTDKIFLSGTIVADPSIGNVIASWSSVDDVVDLESTSLTELQKSFTPLSSTYVAAFQLAIAADSLASGLSYTFELDATYSSDSKSTSTAYVTIVTNEPPSGGVLDISPSAGMALNETFTFTASKWTDDFDDLPFFYSFLLRRY